jgi:hypothetical protein
LHKTLLKSSNELAAAFSKIPCKYSNLINGATNTVERCELHILTLKEFGKQKMKNIFLLIGFELTKEEKALF